jgi:hypothetical protein
MTQSRTAMHFIIAFWIRAIDKNLTLLCDFYTLHIGDTSASGASWNFAGHNSDTKLTNTLVVLA